MAFHNPYHFVPVEKNKRNEDVDVDDFKNGQTDLTHDRYVAGRYSGRIVCRLTTETPIFVGKCQSEKATETSPAEVAPYVLDKLPAIPASTLRGLLSSIIEAASNSALRVLENEMYSFRHKMKSSLSAIGMIVEEGGKLKLRPLTLPNIKGEKGRPVRPPIEFKGLYPKPNLKVYIGDQTLVKSDHPLETYRRSDEKFYYLKLYRDANGNPRQWQSRGLELDDLQKWKESRNGPAFLLAQCRVDDTEAISDTDKSPANDPGLYTRGIVRVLGCYDDDPVNGERCERDIAETKKYEVFIPYPKEVETWKTFEIQQEAIDRFHDLADQRTESSKEGAPLPYHPIGSARNPSAKSKEERRKFRLKDGDLVFFCPAMDGTIEEISLSSIWRGRVEDAASQEAFTTYSFFTFEDGEDMNKELLPFHKDRSVITLAEQMFGFVAQEQKGAEKTEDDKALALAGCVFPSPARLFGIRKGIDPKSNEWEPDAHDEEDNERPRGTIAPYTSDAPGVTLKILSSPKPPSPAMYFKNKDGSGAYIAKNQLDANAHRPQGRKFYLHRWSIDAGRETWRSNKPDSENAKQKVKVTPIKQGAVFYFHLDFDNLSAHALGAMLYALRPTKDFCHKIGMGKPLGLGSVRIEPIGVFRVNRKDRYAKGNLFADRYAEVWRATDANAYPWAVVADEIPPSYEHESRAVGADFNPTIAELHRQFRETMKGLAPDIIHALELIGNPDSVKAPVHTPLVKDNGVMQDDESKSFLWFVANDLGQWQKFNLEQRRKVSIETKQQYLSPLREAEQEPDGKMKTLNEHELKDLPPPNAGNAGGGNRRR